MLHRLFYVYTLPLSSTGYLKTCIYTIFPIYSYLIVTCLYLNIRLNLYLEIFYFETCCITKNYSKVMEMVLVESTPQFTPMYFYYNIVTLAINGPLYITADGSEWERRHHRRRGKKSPRKQRK